MQTFAALAVQRDGVVTEERQDKVVHAGFLEFTSFTRNAGK